MRHLLLSTVITFLTAAALLGAEPEKAELRLACEFLRRPGTPTMSRWEQYAQVLLTSNEMLYVD